MIIGIPVYNDFENLQNMMISLVSSTNSYDKIILIESESKDKSGEYCDFLANKHEKINVIHTAKEGPLKAYNLLFQIAKDTKQDLFLTQTDVIFTHLYGRDWLKEMQDISQNKDCGIITCYGGGGTSGPDFINGFNWVGAWCTYIPYRTIEKLGGYDENIPIGYGVDIDYSYAIEQLGLKTYLLNYWVDHRPNYVEAHEHEHREDIEQLKKDAFIYMRKKWKVGEFIPMNFGGGIEGI